MTAPTADLAASTGPLCAWCPFLAGCPEGLAEVGEGLDIRDNDLLTSLDGLESLVSVWDRLSVSSNPSLVDLRGLERLQTVGGELYLSDNGSLISLAGLAGASCWFSRAGIRTWSGPSIMRRG